MGKVMRLVCGPVLVMLATCSVKDTIFESVPDAALPVDDASLLEDALLIADAPIPADVAVLDAAPPPALGTEENPARTCAELRDAGMPSAVYWVRHPEVIAPFRVYCEQRQELNGGGWAMLYNSVRRDDGTTTAFWQFGYGDRLSARGMLAPDQNYYNGALYPVGREYMDFIVDLQGKTAVAAVMTATGIDQETMRFITPMRVDGNAEVFRHQFAAGWSAQDHDGDDLEDDASNESNCAVAYGNVAQHYGRCWIYNVGADSDPPSIDGGVGPHAAIGVLTSLGLALQPDGGNYSQVNRIARFTRW